MSIANDISKSLRVSTMLPLDLKSKFLTLDEMKDLGEDFNAAYVYYDGMPAFCAEDRNTYEWKEVQFGEKGLLTPGFTYPPGLEIGGVDYGAKTFNFVLKGSSSQTSSLMYIEPSVNVQISNTDAPTGAMFFGKAKLDLFNFEDAALISNNFASQSNYDILDNANISDEIKIYNNSNSSYLGHFKLTDQELDGYRILEIIEKGDWDAEAVYPVQQIVINVVRETFYELLQVATKIELFRGNQKISSIDIAALLDNTGASITGGVLNEETYNVIFTLSNAATISVDFSAAFNALDQLDANASASVASKIIYENLFVAKAGFQIMSGGFYAADIITNYNSTSIGGFPYPTNRSFVIMKYGSKLYFLIKKVNFYTKFFREPNQVLGMSWFTFSANGKSMKKLAYFKILTRSLPLAGLNSAWEAFEIWENNNMPGGFPTNSFNETAIVNGTNIAAANCFMNLVYMSEQPLMKRVDLPYTIKDIDHNLILQVHGTGNLIVPKLMRGFDCGLIKISASGNVNIVESTTSISTPPSKLKRISLQYGSAMLTARNYVVSNSPGTTSYFIVMGDLDNV